MPGLILLAHRETAVHQTPHGPVHFRKYAAQGEEKGFVRASVPARVPTRDGGRAALATLRPAAYPYAGAWLAAIAQYAPERADHRNPAAAPGSVRLLARMTRTHANGVPRQSDGSVSWSVPGASARVWPDGRVEVRGAGGVVLSVRPEGSAWDSARVAAVADAGLRLLCAPEARHMTRTSEPSGWFRPLDRGYSGGGRERNGGQMYDGSSVAACSCGWRVTVPSRDGARGAAAEHLRGVRAGASC
ncbi:hypothetical protein ABZ352_18825 [Streptomyces griseofuscus]|uniref:hypothetical protein n=1 Tax=Streptomyces griseofuscus TaxID=146922 RepID=UPI0033CC6BD2